MLTPAPDRQNLPGTEVLKLARGSIEYGFVHGEPLPLRSDDLPRWLAIPRATFTSLHTDGELRGCCGTLDAAHPLAKDVTHSAFRAAFRDPRFDPLSREEYESTRLEVSVLSPLEWLPVTDEADLLKQLVPGTDGLVVIAEGQHATFLPKVWEMLPDPRQFLSALKIKSGLEEDFWSESLKFQRYRTTTYTD